MIGMEDVIQRHGIKRALQKTKVAVSKINTADTDEFGYYDLAGEDGRKKKGTAALKRNLKRAMSNQEFRDLELSNVNNNDSYSPLDWYEKLNENGEKTGTYQWFDGSFDIEGYVHIGFNFTETTTDVDSNRTQIEYRGETKSSYLYNSETAKYDLLKDYEYKGLLIDKLHPYVNSIKGASDQFSGALVNGFQGSFIALYEGVVNGRDLDGLDIGKLGYEPLLNMESTQIWNNGMNVNVNLHSNGLQEFAKQFAYDAISITPFKANLFKNKLLNTGSSGAIKHYVKKIFE